MTVNAKRRRFHLRASSSIALVVLVIVGVAAVGAASTTGNASTRAVVLFVGDSNITLSAENIDWDLTWNAHSDNGYVPVLASRVGSGIRTYDCLDETTCTTTDYWKTKLASFANKIVPDVIVNDLGINDTTQAGDATTPGYTHYNQKIDWFMALTGSAPVLWTTLPCSIEPPKRLDACNLENYQLVLAASRWPNLTVLRWDLAAAGHPEYMSSPGTDVHFSPAGMEAWTTNVLSALDRRFASP
jgi:lysophospholipase L1-like esterase